MKSKKIFKQKHPDLQYQIQLVQKIHIKLGTMAHRDDNDLANQNELRKILIFKILTQQLGDSSSNQQILYQYKLSKNQDKKSLSNAGDFPANLTSKKKQFQELTSKEYMQDQDYLFNLQLQSEDFLNHQIYLKIFQSPQDKLFLINQLFKYMRYEHQMLFLNHFLK